MQRSSPRHRVISPLSPAFPASFPLSFGFLPFLVDWIIYLFAPFLTVFHSPLPNGISLLFYIKLCQAPWWAKSPFNLSLLKKVQVSWGIPCSLCQRDSLKLLREWYVLVEFLGDTDFLFQSTNNINRAPTRGQMLF